VASEVQICNLSLSHISQAASVTSIRPPGNNAVEEVCAQFFDQARDEVLEAHDWTFATARRSLATVVNPSTNWAFAYQLPNDYIRALAVLPPESTDDDQGVPYDIESTLAGNLILYTNVENAVLKYIRRVIDTGKWTPLFNTTVSRLLAHYISGPITKKPAVVESTLKLYFNQLMIARGANAQSTNVNRRKHYVPEHLKARGVVSAAPDARILNN